VTLRVGIQIVGKTHWTVGAGGAVVMWGLRSRNEDEKMKIIAKSE